MSSINYPILFVSYASLFIFGFVELCRGALYPQILSAFAIGAGIGSLFFTTSSFVGLITNFFAPKWLAFFGQLRSLNIALIFYILGALLLGLSSYWGVSVHFIGAFFVGVASTGVGITINVLTADATPPEKRGRALSGLHAMYALAALLAPLVVSKGDSLGVAWNFYFFAAAALTVLLVIKTSFMLKKEEKVAKPAPERLNWRKYFPYALLFGLYVSGEILTSTRLAFYLQSGLGLSVKDSQTILFQYFLLFFLGRATFIFINVKKHNVKILFLNLLVSVTCLIAGLYLSPWYFPFAGLGMSVFFPVAMDVISERFQVERQNAISVIFLMIGIMISFFHFAFGQITEQVGLRFSMLIIPTMHFCCYLLLIVLRKDLISSGQPE